MRGGFSKAMRFIIPALFYFMTYIKQRSCKQCFHCKQVPGKPLIGCKVKGWKRIVFDISKLLKQRSGGVSDDLMKYANRCKRFKG